MPIIIIINNCINLLLRKRKRKPTLPQTSISALFTSQTYSAMLVIPQTPGIT